MTEPRKELEARLATHLAIMAPHQHARQGAQLLTSAHTELTATCLWKENDNADFWEGACGASWCLIEGNPTDNRITYCPQCGRRVVLPESQENDD